MLRERVCEGWVVHRRLGPVRHQFRYPVWMLLADLERPPLSVSRWLSGVRRLAPLSVLPDDYPCVNGAGTARARINTLLEGHGFAPADRVLLLTQPRSWGWLFNPVSFYFCYRGNTLRSVVAEITNTPWNEVHHYVLDAPATGTDDELTFTFPKTFHVSPFMPMTLGYNWRMKLGAEHIEIAMRLTRDAEEVFFAGLYLTCGPVTAPALRRGALLYPWQNGRTLLRIYYQAFRLWRKGAPFYPHPRTLTEAETT